MSFRVLDESGKPVYGMEFVDYDRFLQSGLCAYYNNINYTKGEVMYQMMLQICNFGFSTSYLRRGVCHDEESVRSDLYYR